MTRLAGYLGAVALLILTGGEVRASSIYQSGRGA